MTDVYVERRDGKIIGFASHPIVGEDGRPLASQEIADKAEVIAEVEAAKTSLVPAEVWAGAMMRALNAVGILKRVDDIVAASDDLLVKKLWDRAAAFRRDDPMIVAVGASVDPPWSESDLDDLFRLAGSFNS